jgi:hypothetical protein
MSQKGVGRLVAAVVLLIIAVLLTQRLDDSGTTSETEPFLAGFSATADSAYRIRIVSPDADPVDISRKGTDWVVDSRNNYPADTAKLSQLFIALASAQLVEEKTSNPENYDKLEVDDPEQGGSGRKLDITGDNAAWSVILGKSAQADFRYARIADSATSYLIDRNPEVPDNAAGWLRPEIVDVQAGAVRKLTIRHSDADTIKIEKGAADEREFKLLAVPEGREPSYPTVGTGIAGALAGLELDDVRPAADGDATSTAVFETWAGLTITVDVYTENDENWISIRADQKAADAAEEKGVAVETEVEENADSINRRVAGWQYRIPDYKSELLTRRWDDLLKATDAG